MMRFFSRYTDHFKTNWFNYGLDTLVVIVGVLIALALNNWNEQRKTKAVLQTYLISIKEDLISDTLSIKRREDGMKLWELRLENYFTYFEKKG